MKRHRLHTFEHTYCKSTSSNTYFVIEKSTGLHKLDICISITNMCIRVMTTKHERISCNQTHDSAYNFSQTSCLSPSCKNSKGTKCHFRTQNLRNQNQKPNCQNSNFERKSTKVLVKPKSKIESVHLKLSQKSKS